ncbi:membrane fusion protein, multidrug efflux system [Chitinophaga costaii]|uniref:Membrane fusion protein, multidrug efflux system n=1 Tax=Chitinophaga costaii TaxID=1335309 RepID=A0A1C3ZLT9_9BACT|nr:efflux RND transporter periplasmic adaptor subunit [Chitinophaga costaii]PUZ30424.1 efflux RND transporter periplasmic adaptor subunit [Chitinophaga costaii]SCB83190.1 membrane fusion protein, multidrug efflux system [Chitinophaga costaii]
MKLHATIAYAVITLGNLLTACHQKPDDSRKGGSKVYQVLTVQPQQATIFSEFPAVIEGQQVIEIRPKVDGYVEAIYVNEGATVAKGQLLFKISNPQYDQAVITANAAIKSAIADVNAARMDVEKVRPLVEKDIVSAYELKSAEYTLESKEAALAQANATLANAETNLGYTFLRAPQAGVIGSIPYKIGALVSSTTTNPLTMLSTISDVYAYFSLNEKQLLNLSERLKGSSWEDKLKQLPPVTLVLANGVEYPQKGRVETASGLIATETGTASLKALFPNPQGVIRSGASATIRLPRVIDTALLVPQSATYELQNKRFVYVVLKNDIVMSTAVTAVPSNNGQFMIVQQGLKAGDRVLIGGNNLKDSTKIVPKPANADSLNHVFQASQSQS